MRGLPVCARSANSSFSAAAKKSGPSKRKSTTPGGTSLPRTAFAPVSVSFSAVSRRTCVTPSMRRRKSTAASTGTNAPVGPPI